MVKTIAPVAALALSTFLAQVTHAAPVDLCVPQAQLTPQWWNPGLSPTKKELRWKGARTRHESHDGITTRVRSLWSAAEETVYFEYRVQGDPSLDATDAVLVALSDASGTLPELFVQFSPMSACGRPSDCAGDGVALPPAAVEYSAATITASSIAWSPMSSVDPSATFEVEHPWLVVEENESGYDWTLSFALVVPVEAGGEIRSDQRIYGNAVVIDPGFTSAIVHEFALLCTSSSPSSNDCLIYAGPNGEVPFDLPVGNMVDSWPVMESGGCGELGFTAPT